ncbi:unnamed protein product, partial [Choristocarpus tenellus]
CGADESTEVRQSAFAVVGELAKSCMPRLRPALPQVMALLVQNISSDIDLLFVCNNASWALGEIATTGGREVGAPGGGVVVSLTVLTISIHPLLLFLTVLLGQAVTPWVSEAMAHLLDIICKGAGIEPSLLENASITVGRLGLVCPETLAQGLEDYCAAWCSALALVRDRGEKEMAFQGLCLVIQHNPRGVANVSVIL